jgi:lactoylglutathione lyase
MLGKILLLIGLAMLSVQASTSAALDRPRITGIADVTLKVSDFAKSRQFYEDYLGYAELPSPAQADTDPAILTIKINDDQYIRLISGLKPEETRLQQISYIVSDAEAMRTHLASQGISVPSEVTLDEQGNRRLTVTGPERMSIGFVEYLPQSRTSAARGQFLPPTRIAPRIRHAGFYVTDYVAANHFFHDILGFEEFWRGSGDGKTISWITLKAPDSLDYVEFSVKTTLPSIERRGVGDHLCLDQPDIVGAVALLQKRNYPPTAGKYLRFVMGMDHKRNLGLYDPDGTRVEMVESKTIDGLPMPISTAPMPPQGASIGVTADTQPATTQR